MKYSNVTVVLLTLFVSSTTACLDLGTQSSSGGAGGSGGAGVSTGTSGGGGSVPVCKECSFGRRYGDDADQGAYNLGMDDAGSVFLSGNYNGAMFLGPNVGVVDGNGDATQAFFAKLDRQGVPQWIVNPDGFGTTGGVGSGIATANGIVAWGGSVGNDPNLRDIFIETRSAATGSSVLAKTTLGSQWQDELAGIALSSDGKTVFAVGLLYGSSATYSGCPQVAPYDAGSNPNVVIMALDSATLNCKWGKTFTGGSHNPGTIRIAVASDGHPVIAGAYNGGTLDGTGLPFGDGAFVMKLDAANGNFLGAKGFPNVLPLALTADASTDRIVVAGILSGALTFAGKSANAPIAPDMTDLFVLAYDGMLNEKWLQALEGTEGQFCQGVSTDGAGRVYAGCINSGKLALPNGPVLDCPGPTFCGMVLALSSGDGTILADKTRTFGDGEPGKAGGIFLTAAGPSGLVMGGSWIVPITFPDGMPLLPNGLTTDYDVVVGKVDPAP
jgi:hypothetical protein